MPWAEKIPINDGYNTDIEYSFNHRIIYTFTRWCCICDKHTLIICNCTPSSVCTPTKHPHTVSTTTSINLLPSRSESVVLPVRCPYAISFYGNKHKEFKHIPNQIHTCRQSSEVFMIRGHFELHASSNGWKYRSASITSPLLGTSGKVPDLTLCVNYKNYSFTIELPVWFSCLLTLNIFCNSSFICIQGRTNTNFLLSASSHAFRSCVCWFFRVSLSCKIFSNARVRNTLSVLFEENWPGEDIAYWNSS